MTYVVVVRGAPPADLAHTIAKAHVEALVRRSASASGQQK